MQGNMNILVTDRDIEHHYQRILVTNSDEVKQNVPKLKGIAFETAV